MRTASRLLDTALPPRQVEINLMRRVLRAFPLVLLLLPGCARDTLYVHSVAYRSKEQPAAQKIAVVDFAGEGGQAIADMMTVHLFRSGFLVVERDRIYDVIREAQMTLDGFKEMSDIDKAQRLGRVLDADVIVTGRLLKLSPPAYAGYRESPTGPVKYRYALAGGQIAARAIEAKSGKVIWICLVNVNAAAGTGKHLRMMDYVYQPCAELVRSFKDASFQGRAVILHDAQIQH